MSTQSPEKDRKSKLMEQERVRKIEEDHANQEARNERKREKQEAEMMKKLAQRYKK